MLPPRSPWLLAFSSPLPPPRAQRTVMQRYMYRWCTPCGRDVPPLSRHGLQCTTTQPRRDTAQHGLQCTTIVLNYGKPKCWQALCQCTWVTDPCKNVCVASGYAKHTRPARATETQRTSTLASEIHGPAQHSQGLDCAWHTRFEQTGWLTDGSKERTARLLQRHLSAPRSAPRPADAPQCTATR